MAFWDNITLSMQDSVGHRVGENGFIGKWRIVVVRDLPFRDQRLNGKIPKVDGSSSQLSISFPANYAV